MPGPNPVILSIVVPVFNEEPIMDELVRRMKAAAESITPEYEIIFVNDGSRDGTLPRLKQICMEHEKLHFLSFSRNFGHQIAIMAGMDYALMGKVEDYMVTSIKDTRFDKEAVMASLEGAMKKK